MFKFFHAVELIYREEVNQQNLNIGNWFQRVIAKVGDGRLTVAFCCSEEHKLDLVPDLVSEYFVVRNHFETKSWKRNDDNCAKVKSLRKKAKVIK